MIDVKDRIPTQPNRKKITYDDGRVEYAKIEYADNPTEVGTPINKVLFDSIGQDINNHANDITAHITNTERNEWNNKLDTDNIVAGDNITTSVSDNNITISANITNYVTGSYTGDGNGTNYISLGFSPKCVIIEHRYGTRAADSDNNVKGERGGMILPNKPLFRTYEQYNAEISGTGFRISLSCNVSGEVYYYIAFK